MKVKTDLPISGGEEIFFDPDFFFRSISATDHSYLQKDVIYSQGDHASGLFYIRKGYIRLTIFSDEGRAATIAILRECDFLGEECLAPNQRFRPATAVAVSDGSMVQIEKERMLAALDSDAALARFFRDYLLSRKIRAEETLADQLSHSSEKRLIRTLLLLADPSKNGARCRSFPEISHEILAEMVGTTRPRITYFMNRFRKMGLVDYRDALHVSKELEKLLR